MPPRSCGGRVPSQAIGRFPFCDHVGPLPWHSHLQAPLQKGSLLSTISGSWTQPVSWLQEGDFAEFHLHLSIFRLQTPHTGGAASRPGPVLANPEVGFRGKGLGALPQRATR